jgi:DNA invertase Pin-like site-specific DNA recombinase
MPKRVRNQSENDISSKKAKKSKKALNTNTIIYTRISSKGQLLGTSINSQQMLCNEYCKDMKFNVLNCISEVSSAKELKKQKLLNNIIDNNSNINLVIYEPTRLTRNLNDYNNLMIQCNKKNIVVHFVQNKLVSSNMNDLQTISNSISNGELEIKILSERVKRSIQYMKAQNIFKSSIAKYGFSYIRKINPKTGKNIRELVKNEKEQLIIMLIKQLYWGESIKTIQNNMFKITRIKHEIYNTMDEDENMKRIEYGNMSMYSIADFLNENKINRKNKLWNSNSVSNILVKIN